MMWKVCFGLSILLAAVGVAVYVSLRKQGKGRVGYLGAGVFLASVVMCFPVMRQTEGSGLALAMSISHSIRMFVIDTGTEDILGALTRDVLGGMLMPYKILACVLYLLGPVFTLTVVLRYFSNSFERMRLRMQRNVELFVFSELNLRTLKIASDVWNYARENRANVVLVFCCSNKKDDVNIELEQRARELNGILIPEDITRLRLNNRQRTINYYLISYDEEDNIEQTLHLIDNMSGGVAWYTKKRLNQRNAEIYCYAAGAEAEILLDAKEKQELKVVLVDEIRDAVYEQLYRHPLYTGISRLEQKSVGDRSCLRLLIAGGGRVGREFLKAAAWCGQMKEFSLEVCLIDTDTERVREKLEAECPELFSEGNDPFRFYTGNIFGSDTRQWIKSLGAVHYCVVALGEDEDSIRAAVMLRRQFAIKHMGDHPFISVYVKNVRKQNTMHELYETTREKGRVSYEISTFGNGGLYYGSGSEAAFELEYLGLGVQAHYFRLTAESGAEERRAAIRNFYEKQGNRRASIANGLHMITKLWEMGYGILRVPESKKQLDLYKELIHPVDFYKDSDEEERKVLYKLEHKRWMAYTRTEGWRLTSEVGSSLAEIRACYEGYCRDFKNQNYLAKLHPALVPIDRVHLEDATLQEVEDMMAEVNREKGLPVYLPDYVQSDIELVDHIGEIVSGSWCGAEGIRIFGMPVRAGEYVICSLEELERYRKAQ